MSPKKEDLKIERNETLLSLCGVSLDESGRQCELAAEVISEERGK